MALGGWQEAVLPWTEGRYTKTQRKRTNRQNNREGVIVGTLLIITRSWYVTPCTAVQRPVINIQKEPAAPILKTAPLHIRRHENPEPVLFYLLCRVLPAVVNARYHGQFHFLVIGSLV
jgi:hypothetical protein